jgi:hypothetical protein
MSFMNPQRGRHMSGSSEEHGGSEKPHVFVHSHKNGHTVHLFHSDGRHEEHEHGHDASSVADRVHESLGGGQRSENESDMGTEGDSGQQV